MKGEVLRVDHYSGNGDYVVWCAGDKERGINPGYLSKHGGFAKNLSDAQRFAGCGNAICGAREYGVAITEDVRQ